LIYQFENIAGLRYEVQGLGLLKPDHIKLHPPPCILNEKQIEQIRLAWEAITDINPEKYRLFINNNEDCMPLLKRAMAYMFYRYPKASNGLSYWDETLLKYTAAHGPRTAKIIGYTLTDCLNGLDLVGDFYLFCRLKNLGRPNLYKPLVKANALNLPMRDTEISILPDGMKALSESLDVIKENGIDDWVGGVHLDSSIKSVWLRKNEDLFHLNY
jgi:hypothetical protein